jgi:AraC-like DNA-binding protein
VLAAADELSTYHDLDSVLRRGVELCRDRLGLERVAIFLYDDSGETLRGSWGTGLAGETTDEHHIYFRAGFHHREATAQALAGLGRWLVLEDAPLTVQYEGETRVVSRGWNAITPILGSSGPIGIMVSDTAISGAAVDESQQLQVAIFCRLLGNVIETLRQRAQTLPWRPLLAGLPHVGDNGQDSLIISIVRALHQDPTLDGRVLARRFGVSPSKLTHAFTKQMGVSMVEYRNRLRLERFLMLVERGGGNLLQAALDAGFGSYAQFHRVFRAMLGATPKEYLTGRK